MRTLLNMIWFVFGGFWLALEHVITAVAQAIANLKMIPISLFPYGKRIVPTDSLSPTDRPLHSL